MAKQTMGEFLAVLRKANGYTQQEIAEKLNISNRTLSSWETDRTTPDILLLPAIADLYGVTVDELLRGERGENEKSSSLSENAIRAARKRRFGIFSFRYVLLCCFGCLSVFLTTLASFLNLCTPCPLWLTVVFAVLGAGGFIACTVLLLCFYINAKNAEGIILDEDYTEDKKAYVLALRRKSKHCFWICAIPLLFCAIVLLIAYFNKNPHDTVTIFEEKDNIGKIAVSVRTYLKTRFRIAMVLNTVMGIILIAVYFIYGYYGINKLLNDTQKENFAFNLKLTLKFCLFGSIPVGVSLISFLLSFLSSYEFVNILIGILFICVTVITVIVCSIMYSKKSRKQTYEF